MAWLHHFLDRILRFSVQLVRTSRCAVTEITSPFEHARFRCPGAPFIKKSTLEFPIRERLKVNTNCQLRAQDYLLGYIFKAPYVSLYLQYEPNPRLNVSN